MNKRLLAVPAVLVLPFTMAAECDTPKAPSGGDTGGTCIVYGRETNSAGTPYLDVKCSIEGQKDLTDSAQVLTDINQYPGCGNGTRWPDCKNG
jgi:hypothetical protein